jgi:putative restriction endonuclease
VYLVAEEPGQFVVALDQAQRHLFPTPGQTISDDDRRYAEAITRHRLHQPLFRARVLQAYENRCSMCHLRHASLLDASHIPDDKHAMGQPVVPNGLALCKNSPRWFRPKHHRRQPGPPYRYPQGRPSGD